MVKTNTINKLNVNGSIIDYQKLLSESFYRNLYTCFKRSLTEYPLHVSDKNTYDRPLSLLEVSQCIPLLKNNKTAGTDGPSSAFYKLFSQQIAPFLLQVLIESISINALPCTLTQGLITLISKPH